MKPFMIVIPGKFERSKTYRSRFVSIAQDSMVILRNEVIPEFVAIKIHGINTLNKRTEARSLINMLRGIVFRKDALLMGLSYEEDKTKTEVVVGIREPRKEEWNV